MDVTRSAFGAWNGGRFMSFGQSLPDDRWFTLVRPAFERGVSTLITADVYGRGAAELIQEGGAGAKPIESKVDGLASLPNLLLLAEEVDSMTRLGNNRGCMSLKGSNRSHTTTADPDRWRLSADLEAVGKRWGVDPDRGLAYSHSD
jgi:hypothetical protein